jgi:hypothetical protein
VFQELPVQVPRLYDKENMRWHLYTGYGFQQVVVGSHWASSLLVSSLLLAALRLLLVG